MSLVVTYVQNTSVEEGFRQVKALVYGDKDVRFADQVAPFGVDSCPPDEIPAIYSDTGANDQQVIVGYLNQDPTAAKGEVRVYSTDADVAPQAYTWWKADGTLELNGADDNAVRYSELEKAFNQLKQDFNAHIDHYKLHTHPTAGTGAPSPPTTAGTSQSSTADISPAKVDTVKLPA